MANINMTYCLSDSVLISLVACLYHEPTTLILENR